MDDHGKQKTENVSLKDINISKWTPKSNPEWLPELFESEEIQAFEIKIGDSLMEKLKNVFAVNRYATVTLNQSVMKWSKNRTDIKPDEKEENKENMKKMEEDFKKIKDSPLEKSLHGILLKPILEKVKEHETKLMEDEYEKIYKEEDDEAKKKEKEKLSGKRDKHKKHQKPEPKDDDDDDSGD